MTPADRRLFEELSFPLLDAAYRTALRLTGQEASAEDLVQEAYLRAFKGFRQFQPGSNFKAWLFRILTNAFLNGYRRKAREPVPRDFGSDPEDGAWEPAALQAEEVEEFARQMGDETSRALDRLPVEFRLPFLLSVIEGFSYKEISDIAGVPIGTVMSRIFRARKMLRESLRAYARGEGYLRDGGRTG